MDDQAHAGRASAAGSRFDRILFQSGNPDFNRPWDTVLHRDESIVLCPTLGSFLPFWYLILPTERSSNFRDWESRITGRSASRELKRAVETVFGQDQRFIWFEHGAAEAGSVTGCGVDYAHLHILLDVDFDLSKMLWASERLGVAAAVWQRCDLDKVYESLCTSREYLIFGNENEAFHASLNTPVGSQFFRRALAEISGFRSDWDYRRYDHQDKAALSVRRVRESQRSGL